MQLRDWDTVEDERPAGATALSATNRRAAPLRVPAAIRAVPLRVRLLVAMVGLVVLTAASVGFTVYSALERAIVPRGLARIEAHVQRLGLMIENRTASTRIDIGAIANAASVRGLVAATSAPEGRHLGLAAAVWRELAIETFVAQVAAKPNFLQLRLIDVDGQEVVRVDGGGEPLVVAPETLQDKSSRDYVGATLALQSGDIYVSRIDLNRERGEVEQPTRPVLRIATPVDAPDGSRWGLAVVNLDLGPLLDEVRQDTTPEGALYLVNAQGDFLLHPDPAREFAFEFGPPRRIQDDLPGLIAAFGGLDGIERAAGPLVMGGEVAAAATSRLAGRTALIIVETAPDRSLAAGAAVRRSALLGGVIVAVFAVFLAVLFARMTGRPIAAMIHAVRSGGEGAALPVHSGGELGVLARSLARYMENERWHGAVLDNASEAFLATAPDGSVTSWNPAARDLFGLTGESPGGRPAETLVASEQAGALRETLQSVASGARQSAIFEAQLAGRNGGTADVLMRISPVRAANGALMGASILARDVTDERAARESFRIVTEHSPAGQLLIDPGGNIILANAEAERCFGYRREELLGRHFELLVPDAARGEHGAHAARFLAEPATRAMGSNREIFGRRKDGSAIPLEVWLTVVPSRQGLLVLVAVVDVSERRETRMDLEKRTAELERSNADLLQFAYVASHDMQEPLRITASFAQLLADRYTGKLDERADKYIHYIVDGARRMQALIGDILVYSRLGAPDDDRVSVPLAQVLEEARAQLAASIEETGARIMVEGELPSVRGDRTQLVRLFVNLVGNAIKYRGDEPPQVHISVKWEAGRWQFALRDNGIGFDDKYKHKIFEMFQRIATAGSARGSGLGLAIAKRIVEQHGGDIWAKGEIGKGATFAFTLPGNEEPCGRQ